MKSAPKSPRKPSGKSGAKPFRKSSGKPFGKPSTRSSGPTRRPKSTGRPSSGPSAGKPRSSGRPSRPSRPVNEPTGMPAVWHEEPEDYTFEMQAAPVAATPKSSKKTVETELVYGVHPIVELLKAKRRKLITLYTTKPTPKAWPIIEKLLPKGTQIQYVTRDVLTKMAGTTDHQSILGYARPFVQRSTFFDPKKAPLLLMLDSIQDPRNVGAILRSASCTGFDGIIMVQKGASPLTATAIKASAGLAEHLEIYKAPSSAAALQLLKNAGYQPYMAVIKGKDAREIKFQTPLCLVIGNEGTGISREIVAQGQPVTLPQSQKDISYNASVAAGILLFMISTQAGKI